MLRLTLIEIASFALPFLIFLIWRWQSEHDELSHPTPVMKLAVIGAGIAVVLLLSLALYAGSGNGHKGEQYVPPRVVDGEMIPGHFIPVEEEAPVEENLPEEDIDPPDEAVLDDDAL